MPCGYGQHLIYVVAVPGPLRYDDATLRFPIQPLILTKCGENIDAWCSQVPINPPYPGFSDLRP